MIALLLVAAGCRSQGEDNSDTQRRGPLTCKIGPKLVPSCGLLWGAAPAAFANANPVDATAQYEATTQSVMDVYHGYHRDGELFPTPEEREVAIGGPETRLLMLNWKPSTSMTWRAIADGAVDHRIQRLGHHIARTFDRPFFFVVWHEPENDVDPAAGSGMTALDYRDMFRHVVSGLRAAGATRLVFVMDYQGYPEFATRPWYHELWPGRRYVDWVGSDSYNSGAVSGFNSGDFADLMNRAGGSWPGFYDYWSERYPDMPLMLAEWGVFEHDGAGQQASFFAQVQQQLPGYPALKAMVYFNSELTPRGDGTSIDATEEGEDAYRELTDSLERVAGP